jgi:hypothetical protein
MTDAPDGTTADGDGNTRGGAMCIGMMGRTLPVAMAYGEPQVVDGALDGRE